MARMTTLRQLFNLPEVMPGRQALSEQRVRSERTYDSRTRRSGRSFGKILDDGFKSSRVHAPWPFTENGGFNEEYDVFVKYRRPSDDMLLEIYNRGRSRIACIYRQIRQAREE